MTDLAAKTRVIPLSGDWRLHFGPQGTPAAHLDRPQIPAGFSEIAAIVPGNIELDLVRAGLLPDDLDHGDNIYRLRPFETHQFWYSRGFVVDDGQDFDLAILVLCGVDTFARIWINGALLADLDNGLIQHELPIGGLLRAGDNEIVIAIDSAVLRVRDLPVAAGSWAMENNWESLSVRKPPHAYGWDIMPRTVLGGLWRDARIEIRPPVRFDDVYLACLATGADAGTATLLVRWRVVAPEPWVDGSVILRVIDPQNGRVVHEAAFRPLGLHGEFVEHVRNVELWWPKGYGVAQLYNVDLALVGEDGSRIAAWRHAFGFRTVELRNSGIIEAGGSGEFRFLVNGVDTFVKGSNWVPVDAFHSRDAERIGETLALARDLNCNMLRCWGGNVYEDAAFFEFCDREGIMVWQDFSLACALYPQTPAMHEAMRREAEAIVPLLRNHTCLVLWAGNNEIDQTYGFASPGLDPNVDDKISRVVLPEVCRRLDPRRAYLPSSPYYGPEVWKRGDLLACPEDHLWGPRDDFKGPFYVQHRALFASEIGYHGCPSRASLERMMRPEQLWPWQASEDWLTHAVRPQAESTKYNYRIPLMATQIEVLFGSVPESLGDYVLASQISQAEALKFFIEMFRIDKGRRSGILWWNIRDGWPQISDAVVDYYGNRKIAHEAVRRAQSDVLVILGEPEGGSQRIVAVNDTAADVILEVMVTADGASLLRSAATIPANARVELGWIGSGDAFRVIEIDWSGTVRPGRSHYLGGRRPFDLHRTIAAYRALFGDTLINAQVTGAA
jgi:beta-mannosidase